MSVKNLIFKDKFEIDGQPRVNHLDFAYINDKLVLITTNGKSRETGKKIKNRYIMDNNQAHLLYLYLQEHLGFNAVPTIPKEYWECKCGKFHQKDYVCTMLK